MLALEYGGSDRSIFIQMPATLSIPMNSTTYNWGYRTEPEPHLDGRRVNCPRGKVLGRSTSINEIVDVRGHPLDFERWEAEGAKGWSYANVLPYFRRAESFGGGGDAYPGHDGPLATSRGLRHGPLYEAFIEAGRQAVRPSRPRPQRRAGGGVRLARHDGEGRRPLVDGQRLSGIRPAMKRPNLTVLTHALASRVAFDGRFRAGACRMGAPDDPLAVVDPQARVIGVGLCASSTLRSCPRSPTAISTRRRS